MVIETFPVRGSSRIAEFTYDDQAEELTITFTDERRYRYTGVPMGTVRGLSLSGSKGAYFDRQIKGLYDFDEV